MSGSRYDAINDRVLALATGPVGVCAAVVLGAAQGVLFAHGGAWGPEHVPYFLLLLAVVLAFMFVMAFVMYLCARFMFPRMERLREIFSGPYQEKAFSLLHSLNRRVSDDFRNLPKLSEQAWRPLVGLVIGFEVASVVIDRWIHGLGLVALAAWVGVTLGFVAGARVAPWKE